MELGRGLVNYLYLIVVFIYASGSGQGQTAMLNGSLVGFEFLSSV